MRILIKYYYGIGISKFIGIEIDQNSDTDTLLNKISKKLQFPIKNLIVKCHRE